MNGEPGEADRTLPVNTARMAKAAVEDDEQLAPLFADTAASDFRRRWDLVQRSFVDDPKEAVHAADELVAEVTQSLAENFAHHRLAQDVGDAQPPTTENLRIALRQYRAFFDRLLSI